MYKIQYIHILNMQTSEKKKKKKFRGKHELQGISNLKALALANQRPVVDKRGGPIGNESVSVI